MSQTLTVSGIEIGKNSFHLVGRDDRSLRRQVQRRLAGLQRRGYERN
jgi:hypothetical protein